MAYRDLYFDIHNIFGTVTNFCIRYAPAKLEKFAFCSAYFHFDTAILQFNIVSRTRIAKVTSLLHYKN